MKEEMERWRGILGNLDYRSECVDALFANTPTENLTILDRTLIIAEEEKEASVLFGKRVYSLVLLEADAAEYKESKHLLKASVRQWLEAQGPDLVSTRILTRHLHKWHALAALGFFPVETLIHLFYELTPEFYGADILTSDVVPMSQVSNDEIMDLVKKAGVKSHIHLDPYLSEEIGDLAVSIYLERLARDEGAVVARRGDRICGFLVVAPRRVPLPGYPPVYELLIGAVDPALADRASVFRDMVSVLSSRAPTDASLFEVRIPHHWFPEVTLLVRAHPVAMETSVVLHYLKDVSL